MCAISLFSAPSAIRIPISHAYAPSSDRPERHRCQWPITTGPAAENRDQACLKQRLRGARGNQIRHRIDRLHRLAPVDVLENRAHVGGNILRALRRAHHEGHMAQKEGPPHLEIRLVNGSMRLVRQAILADIVDLAGDGKPVPRLRPLSSRVMRFPTGSTFAGPRAIPTR